MGVKTEEAIGSSSLLSGYNGYPFSSVFDVCEAEKSSLGFMELLGVQDYSPVLDLPLTQQVSTIAPSDTAKECSEVLNQQPATPNSSSISSASSEAVTLNDEHNKTVDQPDEEHHNTKKQWVFYLFISLTFSPLPFK